MARMPNGVAALPNPRALAAMLRIIAPIAGCSGGTSGNSRTMSGLIRRASIFNSPPFSATFIKPKNSAMTPIKPIARVTEPSAESTMPRVRSCMGESAPGVGTQVSCRPAVTRKAMSTKARKRAFMVSEPPYPTS